MTTRDLLSLHETVAKFDGLETQQCFFMTSLCPNECGHGGVNAVFSIKKYLRYEKPGQYGDKKSDKYYVRISHEVETTGLTPERKQVLDSLKAGDFVLLSWNHDYVHKEGCSYPERPVTKLEKITDDEANKMQQEFLVPTYNTDEY